MFGQVAVKTDHRRLREIAGREFWNESRYKSFWEYAVVNFQLVVKKQVVDGTWCYTIFNCPLINCRNIGKKMLR
jgi:hypothetical protein